MGDSDDEYDRKRRDKFRGERGGTGGNSEGGYRGSERSRDDRNRGRDDWPDRSRRDYRDYRAGAAVGSGSGGRGGYSPPPGRGGGDGPPVKRMRGDWDDARPRYGMHDGYGSYGWPHHDHYGGYVPHRGAVLDSHMGNVGGNMAANNGDTQPAMMSFKAFLAAQDDAITDDDAVKKYGEYKLEFRRQQLNEFFVAHKDEEWFKIKYHPEESLKRREEQLASLKNRLNVFLELLEGGVIESVSVDSDQSDKIIRLLDTVVIKLEGGTDEDLKVLDEDTSSAPNAATDKPEADTKNPTESVDKNVKEEKVGSDENEDETKSPDAGQKDEGEELDGSKKDSDQQSEKEHTKQENKSKGNKKRKRNFSSGTDGENGDSSASESSSDSDSDDAHKNDNDNDESTKSQNKSDKEDDQNDENKSSKDDSNEKNDETKVEKEVETMEIEESKSDETEKKEPPPRAALHKTTSIFLRNLSPTITKQEVEAMCKRYQGYLRVAIADPLQERRWYRRGWLTFRREVNIKDICWNLNNIRLRECELGAIVNRDLSRRVRAVSGLTAHKQVVRSDIKLCARIAHNLDNKAGLWKDENDPKETPEDNSFGLVSKNPVLQNITDYLIEEASAEEDELLGLTNTSETDSANANTTEGSSEKGENQTNTSENAETPTETVVDTIDRDPQLTRVLDKLILYLRVVHSVDFYNHCEYPYEDEMPNRCGIIHARGPAPANKVSQNDLLDYIRLFENKMSTFLQPHQTLDAEELAKLGSKDSDGEVEKFVQANTQELSKDKWLCPLSGKKFKGPDFIRKHIFNKHAEKVEEVRKEVEYFNNYLKDPKRPQLPEHAGNAQQRRMENMVHHPYGSYGGGVGGAMYGGRGGGYGGGPPPHSGYGVWNHGGGRPIRGGFNRGRGGMSDFRPVIHYRDLDAPRELDELYKKKIKYQWMKI
ncbi:serrate RNA effector molecule homolog isoform X3 [Ctenocephalides felis]|uniref:serrate RNA effector molecule homolog isoform X3 n=1 Tax=Ctenocephalides felis TaxID=7515 RepID=UPI000E6E5638|nr:serrate RNA effector molecule homolog isoform X3 [Ctenocephalides felis]